MKTFIFNSDFARISCTKTALILALCTTGCLWAENTSEPHTEHPGPSKAPTGPTHDCPMHPEVTGHAGERCSICGMFLTPVEAQAEAAQDHSEHGHHKTPKAPAQNTPAPNKHEDHSGHDHGSHSHEPQAIPREHRDQAEHKPSTPETSSETNGSLYICPMHPHITGKKGDSCPICGMYLAPKESGPKPTSRAQKGAVYIEPQYQQALGVKLGEAQMQRFGKKIEAFGRLMPSTRLENSLSVRTAGWIVKLQKDAVGDVIQAGDLLFTFYSPDLMTAQADFLIESRSHPAQADGRLKLYGMDDKAIQELKAHGKPMEATPFYAPTSGLVSMLPIREGAYLKAGDKALHVQDYSQIWVDAQLPMRDLQFISEGTQAFVILQETGEHFKATVDYVHPSVDPQSQKGRVRLILDNPDNRLKADSLVAVHFQVQAQERLAVPAQAVLYGKEGGRVIADAQDGYFKPLLVKTGITTEGLTEIKKGLNPGDAIVVTGQFMIDAESTLTGGMAQMEQADPVVAHTHH